ncbi:glycosyltransferase involved in cell wall biosynthesis [Saccharomonospora amisosensis]|uniref:Glycosyltransferase involved in cell wall biosynthesis n=1 Tax=Saccharomonospora amisosensis TaxID=1128677 RepID=A0A7X5UNW0_9PSEU|nr:glycosyltransferase involved in cell wall biosynthesis [Saccharomonospora amisosensis]
MKGVGVYFWGPCYDRKELAALYSDAAVSVVPSAAGLAVIQSISHGVPVLVGDQVAVHGPEWAAITPGLNGDFFSHGDADSLSKAILKWLQHDLHRHEIAATISNWTGEEQAERIVNGVRSHLRQKQR